MLSETTSSPSPSSSSSSDYTQLLEQLRAQFVAATQGVKSLFLTDATGLYQAFLDALPSDLRAEHVCRACAKFVEDFGGVVEISEAGQASSVMWNFKAPPSYASAVAAMRWKVDKAQVVGVLVEDRRVWGQPVTGAWRHLSVAPSQALLFSPSPLQTAPQKAAERLEEYGMLRRALGEFSAEDAVRAHRLLEDGTLYRSEKCLGVARWFKDLHLQIQGVPSRFASNLIWRAVATAPAGWAHVRAGVIGTLLEDLQSGMSLDRVKARFDAKMDPTIYLRPQAPPKPGNVARAEQIVATLESAGAFARRYATLDDVQALWRPAPPAPRKAGGVFEGLGRSAPPPALPAASTPAQITWEKFARVVLPEATEISVYVPHDPNCYAFVTAIHPDAPPVFQWDHESKRNPVSWYTYASFSRASEWSLTGGGYVPCEAVCLFPFMWTSALTHQTPGVLFVLKGCSDVRTASACLFPEMLKSEYHEIRATLEAHSRRLQIQDVVGQKASGIAFRSGGASSSTIRVCRKDGTSTFYILDRWD